MGRESATAFHPHCVIYNIADTTTPKFALKASREKEKKKLYRTVGVKTKKKTLSNSKHVSLSDTLSVSAWMFEHGVNIHATVLSSHAKISAAFLMNITLTAGSYIYDIHRFL